VDPAIQYISQRMHSAGSVYQRIRDRQYISQRMDSAGSVYRGYVTDCQQRPHVGAIDLNTRRSS
jgi:hypothetical protein